MTNEEKNPGSPVPGSLNVSNAEVADAVPQPSFASNLEAALYWFQFGLSVIPVVEKITVLKWDGWLADLSVETITAYWTLHPDHEVGCITGDNLTVFDADTAQATAALVALEAEHKIPPDMIVQTKKGEHHFFFRPGSVFARQDSHSTDKFPERLDVKTGRSMVVLPPSKGKAIRQFKAANLYELSSATQDFVDAIFRHNGRPEPRLLQSHAVSQVNALPQAELVGKLAQIDALLKWIDPNSGYQDWIGILMAIHHESGGSAAGFALADLWSSRGKDYAGTAGVELHWKSFKTDSAKKKTIGTLVMMARAAGADVSAIMNEFGEDAFQVCDGVVVHNNGETSPMGQGVQSAIEAPKENISNAEVVPVQSAHVFSKAASTRPRKANALDRFNLTPIAELIERQAIDAVPLLDPIALAGQFTVIYAPPNTGKTVIIFSLVLDACARGLIDSSLVYYLNLDDTGKGLAEKLIIAREYGFNVFAEGYLDFNSSTFMASILNLIERNQARGVVIILDTARKFVDLMDKASSRNFNKVIRILVQMGATVIALAHTNKKIGPNGRPVHAGTTDFRDDSDCVWVMRTLEEHANERIIEAENIKKRGDVPQAVAFAYSIERGISYTDLLSSVRVVEDTELAPLKHEIVKHSEIDLIAAVEAAIRSGVNTKMLLRDAVAKRADVSKRVALQIIERLTGQDPALHKWNYVVRDRGAKFFELLQPPEPAPQSTGAAS